MQVYDTDSKVYDRATNVAKTLTRSFDVELSVPDEMLTGVTLLQQTAQAGAVYPLETELRSAPYRDGWQFQTLRFPDELDAGPFVQDLIRQHVLLSPPKEEPFRESGPTGRPLESFEGDVVILNEDLRTEQLLQRKAFSDALLNEVRTAMATLREKYTQEIKQIEEGAERRKEELVSFVGDGLLLEGKLRAHFQDKPPVREVFIMEPMGGDAGMTIKPLFSGGEAYIETTSLRGKKVKNVRIQELKEKLAQLAILEKELELPLRAEHSFIVEVDSAAERFPLIYNRQGQDDDPLFLVMKENRLLGLSNRYSYELEPLGGEAVRQLYEEKIQIAQNYSEMLEGLYGKIKTVLDEKLSAAKTRNQEFLDKLAETEHYGVLTPKGKIAFPIIVITGNRQGHSLELSFSSLLEPEKTETAYLLLTLKYTQDLPHSMRHLIDLGNMIEAKRLELYRYIRELEQAETPEAGIRVTFDYEANSPHQGWELAVQELLMDVKGVVVSDAMMSNHFELLISEQKEAFLFPAYGRMDMSLDDDRLTANNSKLDIHLYLEDLSKLDKLSSALEDLKNQIMGGNPWTFGKEYAVTFTSVDLQPGYLAVTAKLESFRGGQSRELHGCAAVALLKNEEQARVNLPGLAEFKLEDKAMVPLGNSQGKLVPGDARTLNLTRLPKNQFFYERAGQFRNVELCGPPENIMDLEKALENTLGAIFSQKDKNASKGYRWPFSFNSLALGPIEIYMPGQTFDKFQLSKLEVKGDGNERMAEIVQVHIPVEADIDSAAPGVNRFFTKLSLPPGHYLLYLTANDGRKAYMQIQLQ